ncbi:MAG: VanZ family protein [Bacteroidota bacterium]
MAWLLLKPGSPPTIHFFQGEDKVAHFGLFMGWSFLMTLRGLFSSMDLRVILTIAVVIALIIGAGTEILQGIIPNRSRDMMDFIADAIGTISGTAVALVFKRMFLNR